MTLEQIIKAIEDKKSLIRTHKALITDISQMGSASVSRNGSWAVAIDPMAAMAIVQSQLDELDVELGRLEEAKKAGEITIEGWLNASAGVKDEQAGTK